MFSGLYGSPMKLWTKICGVTRAEDAVVAADAGADAIGVNFFEKSARYCDPDTAAGIVAAVRDKITVYGVFVDAGADQILTLARRTRITGIQLHGGEPLAEFERLRAAIGDGFDLIRAVPVTSREAVVEAVVEASGYRILFDNPTGGGSGERFDDTLVAGVDMSEAIVAGGLTLDNVGDVIDRMHPYGVDTAGGVEIEPGIKDHTLIREFIDRARAIAA